jgi:fluoroquinolone transport system permease protein
MKNLAKLITSGFTLIRRDPMLLLLLFAPWLSGAALGLGLPLLAPLVSSAFHYDITRWYKLADMLNLMLTPMMAGMLSGFLMLDERDEGVGVYYSVTPIGGAGYLVSRLALPVLWSIVVAPLLMAIFSLSHPSLLRIVAVAAIGGLAAAAQALLLIAFAGNKVEGLAVSKMMGLILLPVVIPFFTKSPWTTFAGVFPAYWMGAMLDGPYYLILPGFGVSFLWLWILYKRTRKKQT